MELTDSPLLFEGIIDLEDSLVQELLRGTGAAEDGGDGDVTPRTLNDSLPGTPDHELRIIQVEEKPSEAPASPVEAPAHCDYCHSKGKIHRRCLRLESCPFVWKRGLKKKPLSGSSAAPRARARPSSSPTPRSPKSAVPITRSARQPSPRRSVLPPARAKPAQEDSPSEAVSSVDSDAYEPWTFPVIISPESLGFPRIAKVPSTVESALPAPLAGDICFKFPMSA